MAVAVAATEPADARSARAARRRAAAAALPPRRRPRRARGAGRCASCRSPASSPRATATAGEPLEDLAQVACVGLLKAIDRYDPERGTGFARYAVPTMLGELKRHFRDKGWALRVPRATQELALKVNEALGTLPAKLGPRGAPARRGRGDRRVGRGGARGDGGGDGLRGRLAGRAARGRRARTRSGPTATRSATRSPGYELVELGEALRGTLDALPARERLILRLRFERDMTQAEIAELRRRLADARVAPAAALARPPLGGPARRRRPKKRADRRRPTSLMVRRPAPGDPSRIATRALTARNPAARPAAARRACAPARRPR